MEMERESSPMCEEVEMTLERANAVVDLLNVSDFSLRESSDTPDESDSDQISYTVEVIADNTRIEEPREHERVNYANELVADDQESHDTDNDNQEILFIYSLNSEGDPSRVSYVEKKKHLDSIKIFEPLSNSEKNNKHSRNNEIFNVNYVVDQDSNLHQMSDVDEASVNENHYDKNYLNNTTDDEIILNPNFRRKRAYSTSSDSSYSVFSNKIKKLRSKTKDGKIRYLKNCLEELSFKFKKHRDCWEAFKQNPDKILNRLNHLKKKSKDSKKIIDDLATYQDKLDLNEDAIISYSERVTRSQIKTDIHLNEKIRRDKLFSDFRTQKK